MLTIPKYVVNSAPIKPGIFAKMMHHGASISLSFQQSGLTPKSIRIPGLGANPSVESIPNGMRIEFPESYIWFNATTLRNEYEKEEDLWGSLIIDGNEPSIAFSIGGEINQVVIGSGAVQKLEGAFFWTKGWRLLGPGSGDKATTLFDNIEPVYPD